MQALIQQRKEIEGEKEAEGGKTREGEEANIMHKNRGNSWGLCDEGRDFCKQLDGVVKSTIILSVQLLHTIHHQHKRDLRVRGQVL